MALSPGMRSFVYIGSIVGILGITLYPIVIEPMMNVDRYKEIQKQTRKGIKQEEIQPGNMKVWTDPFGRK